MPCGCAVDPYHQTKTVGARLPTCVRAQRACPRLTWINFAPIRTTYREMYRRQPQTNDREDRCRMAKGRGTGVTRARSGRRGKVA
ncbi:hypothetical protein WK59_10840 [Burkholderia ubonensis]|nr:hypothetical protein WK59_10840 [Burkholderia ubonensis]